MLNFELKEVEWDERLGFGLEFEFALATLPLGTKDPEPEQGRQIYSIDVPLDSPETDPNTLTDIDRELNVQLHIVNAAATKGFRVASQIQLERHRKAWENGDLQTEPEPSDVQWIVKHDDTIQFPTAQIDTYKWYKVAICTPALMFSPWNLRHIWDFLRIITNRYRLNCNQSCALHVHVSMGKKDFSLDILKNLMGLIFTFERQLEHCHPPYRIHKKPSSTFPHEGLPSMRPPARSEIASLAAIFRATSAAELVHMFSSDEHFRLRYHHIGFLDEPPPPPPSPDPLARRIVFRQHQATTSPERIERWLNVCCRLVEVARQMASAGATAEETRAFRAFLLDHVSGDVEDFGLVMLLVRLGLVHEAEEYGMEMANRPDFRPARRSLNPSASYRVGS
ncbi:hypothetical protein DSL72_001892 [Monilinia vaccinii-corymbosi]|uniref:Amidoligase enzyme n=1 Tax=Monilinia vaccinii-corymbosi TaxID=61207 RepID=A0A8A3PB50_9HELO|nr:hypothetical protein DSL72_001892 [Monilinia vaccinii-corymbosi]